MQSAAELRWPDVSPRVRELFRRGAEVALDPEDEWAAVTLLLEGAPISPARAEAQLGYGLAGPHTAVVVESGSGTASEQLEAAAEAVVRASGAAHRLTVVAGAAALWVWLPVATAPNAGRLAGELAAHPDVRVASAAPAGTSTAAAAATSTPPPPSGWSPGWKRTPPPPATRPPRACGRWGQRGPLTSPARRSG